MSVTGQLLPEAGSTVSQSSEAGLAPPLRTGLTAQGFSMQPARLCEWQQPLPEVGEESGEFKSRKTAGFGKERMSKDRPGSGYREVSSLPNVPSFSLGATGV